MKICSVCSKSKSLEEYPKRSSRCKLCHNIYTRQHYQDNKPYYKEKAAKRDKVIRMENRVLLIEYLKSHPCVDCGNDDIEVLEFDHVDPALKTRNIADSMRHRWETLLAEVEKCVVRCSNCHTKKTRRQLGWWTDGSESIGLVASLLKMYG